MEKDIKKNILLHRYFSKKGGIYTVEREKSITR